MKGIKKKEIKNKIKDLNCSKKYSSSINVILFLFSSLSIHKI